MRIAFVGKGGSGKSTISTLFLLHLISKNQKFLAFDADLNIHVPELLGIEFNDQKALSRNENIKKIREYLIGTSSKIKSVDHFYKTTPPSKGVNFLELNNNYLIQNFFQKVGSGYLSIVGTYEKDEIGISCYHTNLSVFENLLTFSKLNEDEWIVADMVAGIDAFSNTLHAQFDILFLVVEPTTESINVYKQYKELAKHVDIFDNLFVIGNKIEDDDDLAFLKENIESEKIIGIFNKNSKIKKARQNLLPLNLDLIEERSAFNNIEKLSKQKSINPNDRLKKLYELHKKYVAQDYVVNAVGDISDQIDDEFRY